MIETCDYGCGKNYNFQLKNGKKCCENSPNKCESIKAKNSNSLKNAYKEGKRGINTSVPWFDETRAWSRGKTILSDERVGRKFTKEEVFSINSKASTGRVKKIILTEKLIEYKCKECGIFEWNNKIIILELDHVNGIRNDHRLKNLRLLCPNCHSQTETFRGRNINNGIKKISNEDILTELKKGITIRQSLLNLNLAPLGGNYKRVNKIIYDNNFIYEKTKDKIKKVKKEKIIKEKSKCINCNNDCNSRNTKFCCRECYKSYKKIENNIPSIEDILIAFKKLKSFVQVGKYFNISDNGLRKWCINYKIMDKIKLQK